MGLVGILIALGLLIWLAYRGWSILLLAPAAAILAAALAGEPLLAHWTQTFMASAAQFVMQFFPIFLLGALFGKLMEDSGSVTAIAKTMTELGASSKLNAEWSFFSFLRDEGRKAAQAFLDDHGMDLGKRSTLDIDVLLEGV